MSRGTTSTFSMLLTSVLRRSASLSTHETDPRSPQLGTHARCSDITVVSDAPLGEASSAQTRCLREPRNGMVACTRGPLPFALHPRALTTCGRRIPVETRQRTLSRCQTSDSGGRRRLNLEPSGRAR